MFSKELEEVIEAALADGTITEKERAVLHKRAVAEGVDPDELDVVIDGRLSKMKREEDWLRPVPPPAAAPANNSKHGVVRKCPNCGAPIEAGSVKCADCGYTFVGIEANSSVTKLSEMLQQIEKNSSSDMLSTVIMGTSKRLNEMSSAITNFPVPTTKEDLLEFILFLQPKTKKPSINSDVNQVKLYPAYKSKYDECVNKAKLFFADDPQFKPLFAQAADSKKFRWRNMSMLQKMGICYGAVLLLVGIILLICLS